MARQEANVKIWSPDGSKSELYTHDNARDLVMHAGWHRTDPRVTALEAAAKAEIILEATSFDDAEKDEEVVKELVKKSAAKKTVKKSAKAKPTK